MRLRALLTVCMLDVCFAVHGTPLSSLYAHSRPHAHVDPLPPSARFAVDSAEMRRELRYIGQVGKPIILHIEAHNSLGTTSMITQLM